uniref:Uncharacterized protein n=1 Tax=Oryza glaberrima TaxID=4538 RepID=I1P2Z4_ORYGL
RDPRGPHCQPPLSFQSSLPSSSLSLFSGSGQTGAGARPREAGEEVRRRGGGGSGDDAGSGEQGGGDDDNAGAGEGIGGGEGEEAASATVSDLRTALRSSFTLALVSPDFHLFLNGTKLMADARGRKPPRRPRRVHLFHPCQRQVNFAASSRLEADVELEHAESMEKTQVFLARQRRRRRRRQEANEPSAAAAAALLPWMCSSGM